MFEKQKERKVLIAKNLLLGNTCETCAYRDHYYHCKFDSSPMADIVNKSDTCKKWIECKDGRRLSWAQS